MGHYGLARGAIRPEMSATGIDARRERGIASPRRGRMCGARWPDAEIRPRVGSSLFGSGGTMRFVARGILGLAAIASLASAYGCGSDITDEPTGTGASGGASGVGGGGAGGGGTTECTQTADVCYGNRPRASVTSGVECMANVDNTVPGPRAVPPDLEPRDLAAREHDGHGLRRSPQSRPDQPARVCDGQPGRVHPDLELGPLEPRPHACRP